MPNPAPHGHPLPKPSSRPPGKLAQRVEELKTPWRPRLELELSHSETARLATDSLLEAGLAGYRRTLSQERELGFLSQLEIAYITRSRAAQPEPSAAPEPQGPGQSPSDAQSEHTSVTYFPLDSDSLAPDLDLGWPEPKHCASQTQTQVIFQRDKSHSIKDHVRSLLNQARTLIAIVMDLFTDADILCDLLEASNKRQVPVYLLLDEHNLEHFINMCNELDIKGNDIHGDMYCTKSGKKFYGQVLERFMLIDQEQVVAGSYSFTWLSGQVHLNFVTLSMGEIVQEFDEEFRCLYAESKPIDHFINSDEDHGHYSFRRREDKKSLKQKGVPEAAHSNPSSTLSGDSHGSIKKSPYPSTPAGKVLQERKQTSPRASIQTPHTFEWKFTGNQDYKPNGTPVRPGLYDLKPSLIIHYPTQPNQRGNVVSSSRTPWGPPPPPLSPTPATTTTNYLSVWNEKSNAIVQKSDEVSDDSKGLEGPSQGMSRKANRMTLGHSKLEMLKEYNIKMKSKNLYSRFELQKHNS
uniref:Family with sequence similarity 83 member C n=1 Tax=Callorhinchus milii TaxID=7868 RepID=A0A4W3JTW9_CALMI